MTDTEDLVTKLNTQLNKSMVLMEDAVDTKPQLHKRKSITINTKAQPSSVTNSPAVKSRKSILKKSDKSLSQDSANDEATLPINNNIENSDDVPHASSSASFLSRPHTLEEIIKKETLDKEDTSSTFSLEDISDSEEIWIMDLPRLIDPQELRGQVIALEDKSKFKIKDERYCTVIHNTNHNVTCIFNTGKNPLQYKTVNIKPVGSLTIRKKLSGASEMKPVPIENIGVQFPDNLKTRHPLFGVIHERKKRSRKHSSLKVN